jgi:hypothetical protein
MPLTEKTLELNIVHEIINVADNYWWNLWRLAYPKKPNLPRPATYVSGLSLQNEQIHGYDVAIDIPYGCTPSLSFIQFKLGKIKQYSTCAGEVLPIC